MSSEPRTSLGGATLRGHHEKGTGAQKRDGMFADIKNDSIAAVVRYTLPAGMLPLTCRGSSSPRRVQAISLAPGTLLTPDPLPALRAWRRASDQRQLDGKCHLCGLDRYRPRRIGLCSTARLLLHRDRLWTLPVRHCIHLLSFHGLDHEPFCFSGARACGGDQAGAIR